MKFGSLEYKYLLYKPKKFKTKVLIFGGVIEISLGDYFFWATLYVYTQYVYTNMYIPPYILYVYIV
jgi:hypothetical protein